MKILLWTDPHLTDNPIESYRWEIFPFLLKTAEKYKVDVILCLGDLVNTKDRFSSSLVNQLIEECSLLQIHSKAQILILSGNHDKPLTGPYYFTFLKKLGIEYITEPAYLQNINTWLLPFSANPKEEWASLQLDKASCLFMHQTGQGATTGTDANYKLTSNNLPDFKGVPVYSGDVHNPQDIEGIVYVGTPHPVKFDESWNNRLVLVDSKDFNQYETIPIEGGICRGINDISNSEELEAMLYQVRDQVKIRYHLTADKLTDWPIEEEKIKQWADKRGVYLASIEPILIGEGLQATEEEKATMDILPPADIIKKFCEQEKLDDQVREVGLYLLQESQK